MLDEPTAPLGQDSVDLLFAQVRAAVADGTSVVYITHRLAEVRELADRVTVLRDGKVRGTADVAAITDQRAARDDRRPTARLDLPATNSAPTPTHAELHRSTASPDPVSPTSR